MHIAPFDAFGGLGSPRPPVPVATKPSLSSPFHNLGSRELEVLKWKPTEGSGVTLRADPGAGVPLWREICAVASFLAIAFFKLREVVQNLLYPAGDRCMRVDMSRFMSKHLLLFLLSAHPSRCGP